ncbi:MAG: DUF1579 family protein [Polaromonas sp.]|nr:DUF1579 family protein [Gemmatimonadaceae bacterium]
MTPREAKAAPVRGEAHQALAIFLGRWRAEGESYGSSNQDVEDPKVGAAPWVSTHTSMWHTGEFFLIQDERATVAGNSLDTLSVLGVDADTGRYFARCFENHGFYRHYDVSVNGRVWNFSGEMERARIEFSEDGLTQTIFWEWRPSDGWLPLCDRVARRND